MIVPIASKKHDSRTVKTKRTPVSTPTFENPPKRLTWPMSPKSGLATGLPGHFGVVSPQAPSGRSAAAWTTTASSVIATIEIRIAPGTLRTISASVSSAPRTKTSTGQPSRCPVAPSWSGTVVWAASGIRVTKPESTSPISMMNRPIPMEMPLRRPSGTAFMTRSRSPVATSSITTNPARTTMPIASGHDMRGASCSATTVFTPRPAARAIGTLPMTPMRSVVKAAVTAVAVTSWP